jgi:hypothetical protein
MNIIMELEGESSDHLNIIKICSRQPNMELNTFDSMKYRLLEIHDDGYEGKVYMMWGRVFIVGHGFEQTPHEAFPEILYPKLMINDNEAYCPAGVLYKIELYEDPPEDDDYQDYEDDYPEENDND